MGLKILTPNMKTILTKHGEGDNTGQWNVIVVDGKPGAMHNHLMCSLSNLYVSTWSRNPDHTSTLSVTVRLLVSFFEYVPWD